MSYIQNRNPRMEDFVGSKVRGSKKNVCSESETGDQFIFKGPTSKRGGARPAANERRGVVFRVVIVGWWEQE